MFIRFTGRVIINAASLNAQGGEGTNYIPVTRVPVVFRLDDRYQIAEIPAVSGNMVKHYHFANFVQTFRNTESFNANYSLTESAYRGYIAYRFPEKDTKAQKANPNSESIELKDEATIIENFADADLHGYLAPIQTPLRRESICKFSFWLPIEEVVEEVEAASVIHNRVIIDEDGKVKEGMMPFRREYASAPFGFLMVLDLAYVGKCLSNLTANNCLCAAEWQDRVTSAIYAVQEVLLGNVGASRSRAFPAIKVEELIAIASDTPIPAPVHGFYKDYSQQTAQIFASYTNIGSKKSSIWVGLYGRDENILNRLKGAFEIKEKKENSLTVEPLKNLGEIFSKLVERANNSEHKPKSGDEAKERSKKE